METTKQQIQHYTDRLKNSLEHLDLPEYLLIRDLCVEKLESLIKTFEFHDSEDVLIILEAYRNMYDARIQKLSEYEEVLYDETTFFECSKSYDAQQMLDKINDKFSTV